MSKCSAQVALKSECAATIGDTARASGLIECHKPLREVRASIEPSDGDRNVA